MMKANDSTKWGWVYSTVSSKEQAHQIAQDFVQKKLAACAHVLPNIHSYYEYKGKLETHAEVALFLKTKQSLFPKIEKEIIQTHEYECPCLVFIPFSQVSEPFLKWLGEQTL